MSAGSVRTKSSQASEGHLQSSTPEGQLRANLGQMHPIENSLRVTGIAGSRPRAHTVHDRRATSSTSRSTIALAASLCTATAHRPVSGSPVSFLGPATSLCAFFMGKLPPSFIYHISPAMHSAAACMDACFDRNDTCHAETSTST